MPIETKKNLIKAQQKLYPQVQSCQLRLSAICETTDSDYELVF